jgi:EmrB/QacA subfamily drug resistance transporter
VSGLLSTISAGAIYTVLPIIQVELGADIVTIGLAITIYQVITASLMLAFGRLGDLHGHQRIFLAGFAVFIAGSALCGLALTAPTLIAARAAQALGAAMLFSNSIAILIAAFGTRERGTAVGAVSVFTYSGLSAGPPLAGIITDAVGWRGIFALTVILGVVCFAICWRTLPADRETRTGGAFDLPGTILLTAAVSTCLITLQEVTSWGVVSALTLGGLAASAFFAAAFIATERRVASPILDLNLFRSRSFSAATLSAVANYVSIAAVYVLMPFYLIPGRGLSATTTGLILATQPIAQVLAAPLAGTLSDRIGTRIPRTFGMVVLTLAVLSLATLDARSPLELIVVALAFAGLGTGAFVAPNTAQIMSAAPTERRGTANAVSGTARYLGFAIGSAMAAAVVVTAGVDPADPTTILRAVEPAFLIAGAVAAIGATFSALPD